MMLLTGFAMNHRDQGRRDAKQAESEAATRNAALERAARTPSKLGGAAPGALPAPVALPEMGGKSVDLSTVMGRARGLANAWQPEAALLGIEARFLRGMLANLTLILNADEMLADPQMVIDDTAKAPEAAGVR